jgi:predicted glycoside hydrolase/deacetylase ChbG (UPF0249 family)
MTELSERLGYGANERALIVSCDNLGCTQAANEAVYEALRSGIATTAGLMVPCPWAREAASRYRGEDVGVNLTLNAELDHYRWGPITHAPSLLDGDGGYPRTTADLWEHADVDEVHREVRAQLERAILWGFDVSHLSSHLGALAMRPELFDVYLELAVDFRLPLRLPGAAAERSVGFPFRKLAGENDVLYPDHLVVVPALGGRRALEKALFDLEPGVTEVRVNPAIDTPELRAATPTWAAQVDDHHLVTYDTQLAAMLDRAGVRRIGYRELRDAQQR